MNAEDHKTLQSLCNLPALEKKVIQELYEIAARVVYDGVVDDTEVQFLKGWMERNASFAESWPLSRLFSLLQQVLADGEVDSEERLQLLLFLSGISVFAAPEASAPCFASNPHITFEGQRFLFLGRLEVAQRAKAEEAVAQRGGVVTEQVEPELDFLVVGNLGAANWKHSPHAAVVQKALAQSATGTQVVSEVDFIRAIIRA